LPKHFTPKAATSLCARTGREKKKRKEMGPMPFSLPYFSTSLRYSKYGEASEKEEGERKARKKCPSKRKNTLGVKVSGMLQIRIILKDKKKKRKGRKRKGVTPATGKKKGGRGRP